jgi:hypothetical protein
VLLDGANLLHMGAHAGAVARVALVETFSDVDARAGAVAAHELPLHVDVESVTIVELRQVDVCVEVLVLHLWSWSQKGELKGGSILCDMVVGYVTVRKPLAQHLTGRCHVHEHEPKESEDHDEHNRDDPARDAVVGDRWRRELVVIFALLLNKRVRSFH